MKKLVFIILVLLSVICKADITVSGDGEQLIFENNSQTFSIAASSSMSASVNYIWPPALGAQDGGHLYFLSPGILGWGQNVRSNTDPVFDGLRLTDDLEMSSYTINVQHVACDTVIATGKIISLEDASEGETAGLDVQGFRTGDQLRTLEVGVGEDSADMVSFDGLSNYFFDGIVDADSLTLVTPLAVGYGGSGSNTFTAGGVLLGSNTGSFTSMATLADSEFIVGDGTTDPVAESGATVRTSLGLGTGDAVTFTSLDATTITAIGIALTGGIRTPFVGVTTDTDLLQLADNALIVNGSATITGSVTADSFITASDIGVSGDTDLLQLTNDTLTVNGTIYLSTNLLHNGDTDTGFLFSDDKLNFIAGNLVMLTLDENTFGSDEVIVNDAGVDIDFRVEAVGQANALFVQGSDGKVGIGTASPDTTLQVVGTVGFGDDAGNEALFATDGDLTFVGTAGMVFGHMYVDGTQTIIVAITDANPTEVKDDGTTSADDGWLAGDLNLVTFPTGGTEHYLTVTKVGMYQVIWDLSFNMAAPGANIEVHGGIMVDGTATRDKGEAHRTIANNSDTGNMGASVIIDCPNGNEEISLWLLNADNNNDVTVEHGNLHILQIGGT